MENLSSRGKEMYVWEKVVEFLSLIIVQQLSCLSIVGLLLWQHQDSCVFFNLSKVIVVQYGLYIQPEPWFH